MAQKRNFLKSLFTTYGCKKSYTAAIVKCEQKLSDCLTAIECTAINGKPIIVSSNRKIRNLAWGHQSTYYKLMTIRRKLVDYVLRNCDEYLYTYLSTFQRGLRSRNNTYRKQSIVHGARLRLYATDELIVPKKLLSFRHLLSFLTIVIYY